jgi:hypothetical protein
MRGSSGRFLEIFKWRRGAKKPTVMVKGLAVEAMGMKMDEI